MDVDDRATYEMASVLFMDIVSYSLQPIDRQSELLSALQRIVRESAEFQHARSKNEMILLPTGDGMALVFMRDPVSPVKCALEIARSLEARPEVKLRMGVHTGPVCRHADIKEEVNVVGGGINMAQRVMDCGDAGHILLSRNVAEVLQQFSGWRDSLRDLGEHEVKHGVKVQLYNLVKDGLGNPALPRKVSAEAPAVAKSAPTGGQRSKWPALAIVAVFLLALAGFVIYQKAGLPVASRTPPKTLAAERTLLYHMIVQKYRNGKPYEQPFRSTGERTFEADYRIWLVFSSPQAGYLYILNEGPTSTSGNPVFNMLFPAEGGLASLSARLELKVPQGGPLKFDKENGIEKLWLIWSKESQPELDALKKWANRDHIGKIGDPMQLHGIQRLVAKYPAAQIERDDAQKVSIVKASGDVLVHLLKLEHD
jgi:class 3 adenylate cyclase